MRVRHSLGRLDVELPVLDARRDPFRVLHGSGRCRPHQGRTGQRAECRE
jgi:hypothetical protein